MTKVSLVAFIRRKTQTAGSTQAAGKTKAISAHVLLRVMAMFIYYVPLRGNRGLGEAPLTLS